jgi:hypothetical protein
MAIRQPPTSFKDPNQRQFLQELRNAIKSVTEQVDKIKPRVINVTNGGDGGGGGGGDGPTQAAVILTANPAAPVPGAEFTLTATVTGNSPTGSLAFSKDGTAISTVPLGNGVATLAQTLTAGSYTFTAAYSGDARNRSASASMTVTVATSGGGGDGDGLAPPAPLSLVAIPEPWAIRLEWTQPTLPPDYAWTEVWARATTSGAKILIGEIAGNQFTFSGLDDALLSTDDTYYFWVRNKDTEGLFSAYTPNDDVGVEGQCLPSPDSLINDLVTDITDSTLWNYLGQKVQLLEGPVGMPNSVSQRLDAQKGELVQMINDVTVSTNGTIDTAEIWHFDTSTQGWTVSGTGATVTMTNGVLIVAAGSATATVLSPTINVSGPAYHAVRARMKQVKADPGDDDWEPTLAYKKSGSGTVYTYTPITPAGDLSGFVDFDWELADEDPAVWTVAGTVITQVGFQLAAGQTLHIDWAAVGRVAPGASYAQVEAVRVNSNRSIYTPNSGAPNYAGPTSATLGYALRVNDIWFDTATAVFDGSGNLLRGGNKPHYWNGSAWVAVTDERLRISYSEIWNIANAVAGPTGSAANRISGIATTSSSALTTAQSKASLSQVESAFAGDSGSLSSRLNNIEASIGGENNVSASIREFQKAAIGYATLNSTGAVFEGNGAFVVYPVATYPDASFPQYAATNRRTIIDSLGVDRWNAGNPGNLATWKTGLPLATAIKQVSITAPNATLGPQTATVQQQFEAIYGNDGLRAQWSVKIDNNGWVSGFGLSSTPGTVSGDPFSDFGVRADRFYVGAPNTPKTQPQPLSYLSLQSGTTTSGIAIVFRKHSVTAFGVTTRWLYFKATSPGQFSKDQWAVVKGVSNSVFNTTWLVDHIGPMVVYNTAGQLLRDENTFPGVNDGSNPTYGASFTVFIAIESQTDYNNLPSTGTVQIVNNVVQATANPANIPFIVLTTSSPSKTLNGLSYPPGVYATSAYIKKAQITEATIADLAVTNAKIANVIQSNNFAAGSSGWKIDKTGSVEFNNGTWRGTLQSSNFVTGTSGWQINQNGNAEFNTVIARTKNIEANAVTRVYSGSSNGYVAYNPATLSNLSIPLNGERGDIVVLLNLSIQSAPGTSCQVWFEGYINNSRLDYKNITTPRGMQFTVSGQTVVVPPPGGYGSATLLLKDASKASTMTASLVPTVIDGTPTAWSWSYIAYELKR